MCDIEANKALIDDFYRRFRSRDWAALRALLADDATYWIAGRMAASGLIVGAENYVGFVKDVFGRTIGPIATDILRMTAEGDRVAVEVASSATFANGFRYANELHVLFIISDGRIAAVREYLDTEHAAETLRSLAESDMGG